MEGGEGRMGGNERMERGRKEERNKGREGEMTSKHWSTAVCPLLLHCCMGRVPCSLGWACHTA